MARIVVLSDIHLSPTHGFFWENWRLAREFADAANADQETAMRRWRQARAQAALLIAMADIGGVWDVVAVTAALTQLADAMIMDRATLGHNVRPLEARALVRLAVGKDRRSHEVSITAKGRHLIRDARALWEQAQRSFESELGQQEASALRAVLQRIAATEFTLTTSP